MKTAHKFQIDTFTGADILMLHIAALRDLAAPQKDDEANTLFKTIRGMILEMTSMDMPAFWIFNAKEMLSSAEIAKHYYDEAVEAKDAHSEKQLKSIIETLYRIASDSPR